MLVFGDNRVRGTQEQMMLQVDPVRLSIGAGGNSWKNKFMEFLSFMVLNKVVKLL